MILVKIRSNTVLKKTVLCSNLLPAMMRSLFILSSLDIICRNATVEQNNGELDADTKDLDLDLELVAIDDDVCWIGSEGRR
jgi:hypothetical protein